MLALVTNRFANAWIIKWFLFFSTISRRREGGKVRSNYGRVTMQTPEEIHPLSPPSWAIFQTGQEAFSVSSRPPPTAKYTVTRILSKARAYFENIAIEAFSPSQRLCRCWTNCECESMYPQLGDGWNLICSGIFRFRRGELAEYCITSCAPNGKQWSNRLNSDSIPRFYPANPPRNCHN